MKKFMLMETAIPTNLCQAMDTDNVEIDIQEVVLAYEGVIKAMSDFLGQAKTKDSKVSLAVKDLKGKLVIAGIVGYHKGEEEGDGNWSYTITLDEKDLEGTKQYLSTDTHFERVYSKTIRNLYGYDIQYISGMQPFFIEAFNALKHWLDINADEIEPVKIEQAGYFVATVEIENGDKVMSIVPDGAMKKYIKDDAALES